MSLSIAASIDDTAPTPHMHIKLPSPPTHRRVGSNNSTNSMSMWPTGFRRSSPSAFHNNLETPRVVLDPHSQIYGQRAEAIRASQRYTPPPVVVPQDDGGSSGSDEDDDFNETMLDR